MIEQTVFTDSERQAQGTAWKEVVAKYQQPAVGRSVWQLVNTLVPYAVLWYLMYRSLAISYWLTVPLAVLACGFLVRIFIIFHDCGHGSFFKSRKANDILGVITGVLTFTPYYLWRWEHAVHHASSGDLDRRGRGDVDVDGARVPRIIALEAVRVSAGAQSIYLVCARADVPVSDPPAVSH